MGIDTGRSVYLVGSPPEERKWNPGRFSLSYIGFAGFDSRNGACGATRRRRLLPQRFCALR